MVTPYCSVSGLSDLSAAPPERTHASTQSVPSANMRPSEPWIDLLQKSDAARCFQLSFGDKLNFRFCLVIIPFIPGSKGLDREARGVNLASGTRQNEDRQARDVGDLPQ
jgi:hypothetical protein